MNSRACLLTQTSFERFLPWVLLCSCLLLISACGGSSSGGDDNANTEPDDTVASASIGSEGGSLSSTDGKLTLTLPEGAVAADTEISITAIDASSLPAAFAGKEVIGAYELAPSGTVFTEPVSLTLAYDSDGFSDAELQGDLSLNLFTLNDGELEVLGDVVLTLFDDQQEALISGELSHFSPLVLTVESIYDSVIISGVPDASTVGQTHSVEIKYRHFADSQLSVDKAIYRESFDDEIFGVIEPDQAMFNNDPDISILPYLDFGMARPGVASLPEKTVRYACKKTGITYFDPEIRYLNYNNATEKYVRSVLVNAINLFKPVTCINSESGSLVQLVDERDPEASARAEWFFDVTPASTEASIGDTFSLLINERGPFHSKPGPLRYEVKIRDTNPGVISDYRLGEPATVNGTNNIEPGRGIYYFEERLNVDTLYIKDVVALLNTQKVNFSCLTAGQTKLVFQLRIIEDIGPQDWSTIGSEAVVVPITCSEASIDNDRDSDGVLDSKDLCPEDSGSTEHGCNIEKSDNTTRMGCSSGGNCDLSDGSGNCSQCGVIRLDSSTRLISNTTDDTITISLDATYTTSGTVEYSTELISGTAGEGAMFVFDDDGITCESDNSGQGCNGTFQDGTQLGCPSDSKCRVQIIQADEITGLNNLIRFVDVQKNTINNDGEFDFNWVFTIDDDDFPPASGSFSIQTESGTGTSSARLYFADDQYFIPELIVAELPEDGFELTDITCEVAPGTLYSDSGFSTDRSNSCQFENTWNQPPETALIDLPFGAGAPGEFNLVADGGFGLSVSANYVSLGYTNGLMILNSETGESPAVGNRESLNFSSIGLNNSGAYVLLNPSVPTADRLTSYGDATISFYYDPELETFSSGILGFDVITDVSPLGGDVTSSTTLQFNNGRNRIDAQIFNADPGSLSWEQRTLTQPENLENLNGNVVSGFAWDLGRLDCYNPCQGSGQPMPSGCQAEIDQVIGSSPSCADAWTPTSCESAYNAITDNFCERPLADQQVNFGGMVLGVTDGATSELFLADPALTFSGRVQSIGVTGADARRVECAGQICVVTNFGSDTLTIVTWDGLFDAAIVATVNVGDGPVGTSILENTDGTYEVFSTGSLSNTWHRTTVSADGTLIQNLSTDAEEGCEGPEGITWVPGKESIPARVLVSCKNTDNFMRITPQWPLR